MSSNILTVRVQRLVTVIYEADIDVAEADADRMHNSDFANIATDELLWTEVDERAGEVSSRVVACYSGDDEYGADSSDDD